ncbi:MAG: hypothetical protein LBU42_08255 [Prevotellaceae bacterium]|jgi:hypothetical protein|nr:hypothetical protein [Prevotellaceae bacterium]
MSKQDWLPDNHSAIYMMVVLTWNFILAPGNRARMGFAADTPLGIWFDTVFSPAFTTYNSLYAVWNNESTRTKLIDADFREAEVALKALYRHLYKGFLKDNPLVTNSDLIAMGLPERSSGGGGKHPVPTSTVVVDKVVLPSPGVVDIHFRDSGSDKKAKPFGVHGAELVFAVSDTPITDHNDLLNSRIDTSTPFHLTFSDSQRGKTCYFSLRWENTTGEKGPWNTIENVIIP